MLYRTALIPLTSSSTATAEVIVSILRDLCQMLYEDAFDQIFIVFLKNWMHLK